LLAATSALTFEPLVQHEPIAISVGVGADSSSMRMRACIVGTCIQAADDQRPRRVGPTIFFAMYVTCIRAGQRHSDSQRA
jgi:hypothetical protein